MNDISLNIMLYIYLSRCSCNRAIVTADFMMKPNSIMSMEAYLALSAFKRISYCMY